MLSTPSAQVLSPQISWEAQQVSGRAVTRSAAVQTWLESCCVVSNPCNQDLGNPWYPSAEGRAATHRSANKQISPRPDGRPCGSTGPSWEEWNRPPQSKGRHSNTSHSTRLTVGPQLSHAQREPLLSSVCRDCAALHYLPPLWDPAE